MRRLIVVVLALSLFSISLFASGNRQQQPGPAASGGKTPLTISFWWDIQDFPQYEADAFGKFIEDKFNVDIKLNIVDWGDYTQKFRLWAASGDLPDTFSGYPANQSWFPQFVREGFVRPIPYSMISRYPLLKRTMDSINVVTQFRDYYGDYYYLPRPEAELGFKISGNQGMYYRKDWATKLGFNERPTDLVTFYNMLEAFVTKDPDGNGRNDTYGWTTSDLSLIYNAYGAFPERWINGPNGRIIPGWADESPMVQGLTWLRNAYTNNLLDREFPGASNNRAAKFGQGIFGVVHGSVQPNGVNQYVMQQFTNQSDPLRIVDWIYGFSPVRGGTVLRDFLSETSGAVFRAGLSDAMLHKYLEIWEYLLTDEAKNLTTWGFKDVDYRIETNGTKTSLLNVPLASKYPSVQLRHWANWGAEVDFTEGPASEKPVRDFALAWQVEANKAAQNGINLRKVNELASLIVSEERGLFDSQFNPSAALFEIISGSGDITTMYRAMIENANRRGLQRAIDAQTALMARR